MGWEVGVCSDWCWSWCSFLPWISEIHSHPCAAGCPTFSTALLGHKQLQNCVCWSGLWSGAPESCTVLGKLLLPWGFCGLWQMMPWQRQTPGVVASPAWTQSVSSSRWLFVKQGFQSQPQFTETCTCTCLIWKYGKDLESQNVNSATRATSNTYIRCGFECKDFTLLSWLKKSPSDFFLKAEEMIKSNLFALSNIQNTKDLRILKFLRLEKTFKMTKSKYQPSTTTMSTVKPCLHVLCPDVACISQTHSGFGESPIVAI